MSKIINRVTTRYFSERNYHVHRGHCPLVITNTLELNHIHDATNLWISNMGSRNWKRVIGASLQLQQITTFYDFKLQVECFPSSLAIKNAMALND